MLVISSSLAPVGVCVFLKGIATVRLCAIALMTVTFLPTLARVVVTLLAGGWFSVAWALGTAAVLQLDQPEHTQAAGWANRAQER